MKKKLFFVSILCFVMLLTLTGCGKKTAISGESFKSKASEEGYGVITNTVSETDATMPKEDYVAITKESDTIEFMVFADAKTATNYYNNLKNQIENIAGTNKTKTEVNLSNYSKYTVTTSSNFAYLSRIDNTLLIVDAKVANKDSIKNFAKKLGY